MYNTLCVSSTMLRQSQGPRQVPREHAECFVTLYLTHTSIIVVILIMALVEP